MKLSLVICVYNTDKKLFEECLCSIRQSTLASEDYEICIVDDGSQIDYSDLVEKYQARYKKTENRGILSARIEGIEMANSDYIAFIDSDDSVSVNYHRPMLELLEEGGYDIVLNDWAFNTARAKYFCQADSTISSDIDFHNDDVLLAFTSKKGKEHSYYVLWNKMFKSKILKQSAEKIKSILKDTTGFVFSEDVLINFFAHKYAKSLRNIHTGFYFYRVHAAQSVNVISQSKLDTQVSNMAKTFKIMLHYIKDEIKHQELEENISAWRELMSRTHFSYAKVGKYYSSYDLIKDSYEVTKLRKSFFKDSSAYSNNRLLPTNFDDIDSQLLQIFRSKSFKIKNKPKSKYEKEFIDYCKKNGTDVSWSKNGTSIIKPHYNFINIILMNHFVYSVGLLLFKKGSRIRNFLKRYL